MPVFPFKKEAIAKCIECDSIRSEERFGPKLNEYLKEELVKTKHPFYTWTLLLLLISFLIFILVVTPKE